MIRIYGYILKVLETILSKLSKSGRIVLPNCFYDVYHHANEKKILRDLSTIVESFQGKSVADSISEKVMSNTPKRETIWVMWWQKDNVPQMVKHNISMMRKNLNKRVVVLNEESMSDYLNIPDEIYVGLSNGTVTFASFSDYVRTGILYQYGGLWLDSTILILSDDNFINDLNLNMQNLVTINGVKDYGHKFIATDRWTVYCIGGVQGQSFFKFVNAGLEHYLARGLKIPNYFLVDYLFDIAYKNNFGGFQNEIVNLSENNILVEKLARLMNDEFDLKEYKNMIQDNKVFKLSLKRKYYARTKEDQLTYFGYLKEKGKVV